MHRQAAIFFSERKQPPRTCVATVDEIGKCMTLFSSVEVQVREQDEMEKLLPNVIVRLSTEELLDCLSTTLKRVPIVT